MTEETPIDRAHAAMQARPEEDGARLAFYERLADAELFLMLQAEADDGADTVTPELFEVGDARNNVSQRQHAPAEFLDMRLRSGGVVFDEHKVLQHATGLQVSAVWRRPE